MTLSQIVEYWAYLFRMDRYCSFVVRKDKLNGEFGHAYMTRKEGLYKASIVINEKLPNNSVITEGVLWHEFVHCYNFYCTGKMGHGLEFWSTLIRGSPWLAIAPYLLFPITIYYLLR